MARDWQQTTLAHVAVDVSDGYTESAPSAPSAIVPRSGTTAEALAKAGSSAVPSPSVAVFVPFST